MTRSSRVVYLHIRQITRANIDHGDRLRALHPKSQEAEALIACNILNGMTTLGRPASCAIGV
jgi:hypothetical protein